MFNASGEKPNYDEIYADDKAMQLCLARDRRIEAGGQQNDEEDEAIFQAIIQEHDEEEDERIIAETHAACRQIVRHAATERDTERCHCCGAVIL